MKSQWEAIIGLEVHVQLSTKTKLFSSAPNNFGDEPNTNITAVCTGHPGTLPTINEEAVHKAVLFGLAVNGKVAPFSQFERKSYFYPDTPRNFQITQYKHPIILGGAIETEVEGVKKIFHLNRAHLEDDSATLKHFSTFSGIDFNRAGAALIEVVSEPELHSSKDAIAYLTTLKAILQYTEVSDCNMEKGSLRVDANISVRLKGEKEFRPKTEIKNMNSFNFLEIAIDAEIERQIALYTANPDKKDIISPGTYRWDSGLKKTILMRKKESAEDYRYFPEPDLLPLLISQEYIDEIKKTLPELPQAKVKRYIDDYHLSKYEANLLTSEKQVADYFEKALQACSSPRLLCSWITTEFAGRLKEKNETLFSLGIPPENIGQLVHLIDKGKITGKIGKMVADQMILFPSKSPREIVAANPAFQPVVDDSAIEELTGRVLAENEKSVQDYQAGRTKSFAYLMGQAMKLSQGKADPEKLGRALRSKLEKL